MFEQLYPCDHCGGRPTIGRSQQVIDRTGDPYIDGSAYGIDAGPPVPGDVLRRPPEAPPTEKIVCIYCSDCGMSTAWVTVGDNEKEALDRCAAVWNRRLNRPKTEPNDIQALIERELGACDTQFVLDLLSRNKDDWETRGPIFGMLARRLRDATVVTSDTWPIAPVLEDAARYRKLLQLVKLIIIDAEQYAQFPRIPVPAELREFVFEDSVSKAVDAMPDRDRW
jgi:hypothetical protein